MENKYNPYNIMSGKPIEKKNMFCSAVNCIDGRVQLPVIEYMKERFQAEYVDIITEAGPNLILWEKKDTAAIDSIFERLGISIDIHDSAGIAVVGHYDCAANPAPESEQLRQIQESILFLKGYFKDIPITGLWVDRALKVREIKA